MNAFSHRVYNTVKRIPSGKVATYGQIAFLAGSPRASRIVGALMANAPEHLHLPCHRVIYADGSLCKDHDFLSVQRVLLQAEGITFLDDGRVNLRIFQWNADM